MLAARRSSAWACFRNGGNSANSGRAASVSARVCSRSSAMKPTAFWRGFRSSWARPAARRPTATSFSCRRTSALETSSSWYACALAMARAAWSASACASSSSASVNARPGLACHDEDAEEAVAGPDRHGQDGVRVRRLVRE